MAYPCPICGYADRQRVRVQLPVTTATGETYEWRVAKSCRECGCVEVSRLGIIRDWRKFEVFRDIYSRHHHSILSGIPFSERPLELRHFQEEA